MRYAGIKYGIPILICVVLIVINPYIMLVSSVLRLPYIFSRLLLITFLLQLMNKLSCNKNIQSCPCSLQVQQIIFALDKFNKKQITT